LCSRKGLERRTVSQAAAVGEVVLGENKGTTPEPGRIVSPGGLERMTGFRGVVTMNSVVTLGRTTVRVRNLLAIMSGEIKGKSRTHE
jgi:hypothetical protein